MRRPSLFRSRENDFDSMMTPMIDVVFLLLVFFVWTASVQLTEYVLHSQVSAQLGNQKSDITEPPPEQDFDDVIVKIGWNGESPSWQVNEIPFGSIDQVNQQLQAIAQVNIEAPIVLDPDSLVPIEFVIEAYDIATLAGFQKVSFSVEQGSL